MLALFVSYYLIIKHNELNFIFYFQGSLCFNLCCLMNKIEILVFLVFSMFLRLSLVVVWLSPHLVFLLLSPNTVVPNLFGTRDWFCGRQFFHGPGDGGWFQDDSNALHWLCTLFLLLHWLHLRSSGIRSWKLGTSGVENSFRWDQVKASITPQPQKGV